MPVKSTFNVWLSGWALITVTSGAVFGTENPTAPEDLQLESRLDQESKALSHFAWGFFLQLNPQNRSEIFLQEYQNALELLPESKVIADHLVRPLLASGDTDRLVEYLHPVAKANPRAEFVQLLLGEALVQAGKLDEGIAVLEHALSASKWQFARLVRELSVLYWRAKRYDDVKRLIKRALRRKRLRNTFLVQHAAALYYHSLFRLTDADVDERSRSKARDRAFKHAQLAAERIVEIESASDIDSLVLLLAELGAWPEVVSVLRQALSDSRFVSLKRTLFLADALLKNGDDSEALSILDEVSGRATLPVPAYVELGRLYLDAGQVDKAVVIYSKLLLKDPENVRLRLGLGYLLLRQGKATEAIEVAAKSKRLGEEEYYLISRAHSQLKDYPAASKALLKAESLAIKAKNTDFLGVDFLLYHAELCERLGLVDQAVEKARQALALDPDSAMICNFLGYVLADHNRSLPEARDLIQKAVAAEPDNVAFLDSLAWVWYRLGEFPKAYAVMQKALKLSGDTPDPVILDHAGDICLVHGKISEAIRYWQQALEQNPPDAKAIREKLEKAVGAGRSEVGGRRVRRSL